MAITGWTRREPTWRVLGSGAAFLAAVLGPSAPGMTAEPGQASAAPSSLVQHVAIEDGGLTVEIHDADLADVLRQISGQAGFKLAITGELGRVTAAFEAVSLDVGLRRLAQHHELMLVYGPAGAGGSQGGLVEVRVFSASQPQGASPAARPGSGPESSASASRLTQYSSLAEIDRLLRTPDDPASVARLMEVLGTAPDAVVRARAAKALGQIGGTVAGAALAGALNDQNAAVRVQVVDALLSAEGPRAIPTLRGVLLGDADTGVRRAAARALGTLKEAPATAALNAGAEDPDRSVRREVRRSLRRHGAPDP